MLSESHDIILDLRSKNTVKTHSFHVTECVVEWFGLCAKEEGLRVGEALDMALYEFMEKRGFFCKSCE